MELLAAFLGAVVGGGLVIVGDSLGRRKEWRREAVKDLAHAAADLAGAYIRVTGEATDGRERGLARTDVGVLTRPDRYEALTRFFIQPGSEHLRSEAKALSNALGATLEAYEADDVAWGLAREQQKLALYRFEEAVRDRLRCAMI